MNPLDQLQAIANQYAQDGANGDRVATKAAVVLFALTAALHFDERAITELADAVIPVCYSNHKRVMATMVLGE